MTHANPLALAWLRRSVGSWESERRYLFSPNLSQPVNMTTRFSIEELEHGSFLVSWTGRTSGEMELNLDGDYLKRSRDYMASADRPGHASRITMQGPDRMVLETSYDGVRYREEILLLESDTIRLRQTLGMNLETGQTQVLGQYFERRQ